MSTPASPVRVVSVPICTKTDEHDLLLPASVLAAWFGAPVQLLTQHPTDRDRLDALTSSLGTDIRPAVVLEGPSFVKSVVNHLRSQPGSLCVASAGSSGFAIARLSEHPTYIAGDNQRNRLPSGPLVLELDENETSNTDILATAAMWAKDLELGVRVVATEDGQQAATAARDRLRSLGVAAGVDRLRPHGLDPAVLVARTREALALVVPQDRVDEAELGQRAIRGGVSVLVVPTSKSHDVEASLDEGAERDSTGRSVGVPRRLVELSDAQCWDRLRSARVGRVAYVDHGWPTVVPINFSVNDRELFIRSLDGGKSEAAERGDMVCLQIDEADIDEGSGWSVLARGHLHTIHDPSTLQRAWANDPHPYVAADEWHWLRLVPIAVTGRSLAGAEPTSGSAAKFVR